MRTPQVLLSFGGHHPSMMLRCTARHTVHQLIGLFGRDCVPFVVHARCTTVFHHSLTPSLTHSLTHSLVHTHISLVRPRFPTLHHSPRTAITFCPYPYQLPGSSRSRTGWIMIIARIVLTRPQHTLPGSASGHSGGSVRRPIIVTFHFHSHFHFYFHASPPLDSAPCAIHLHRLLVCIATALSTLVISRRALSLSAISHQPSHQPNNTHTHTLPHRGHVPANSITTRSRSARV